MTTWATFKTIAETSNIEHGEMFYVDRLGKPDALFIYQKQRRRLVGF